MNRKKTRNAQADISVIDASAEHKPTRDENIPVKPLPITISDLLSLGKNR